MNKLEDVVAGSKWARPGNPGRVLTIVQDWSGDAERVKAMDGQECSFKFPNESTQKIAFRKNIVEWGELVGYEHDLSDRYLQRKGLKVCGRCLEIWPTVAMGPKECKPSTDPRPPQVVIEEKVAQLMGGG
jgi:hypothetical protein